MNRTSKLVTLTLTTWTLAACGGGDTTTENTTATGTTGVGPTTEVVTSDVGTSTTDAPTTAGPTTAGPTTGTPTTAGPTTGEPDDTTGPVSGSTDHGSTMPEMTTEPPPSCDDVLQNQDETDVDCGGATCSPCADGLACMADSDCAVASCVLGVCAAPACDDGVQNADETDADCGGGCSPCADNLACVDGADCTSQVCTDGLCTPASCSDTLMNGDETDIDCGGAVCDGCFGDAACIDDSDCLSETCIGGICGDVGCQNAADCDALDTECAEGSCKIPGFQCEAVPKNNGLACENNELCVENTTCTAGVCGGGPKDCSALSDACHVGSCDIGTGECISDELDDGIKCEDGNLCTKLEVCKTGVCGGSLAALFTEDFSDNLAGWTLGTEWAIGPAKASMGCTGGADPAMDHTPSADNGVAGVVIGGCLNTALHDYYCLTSPVVDLTTAPADVHLSYWRWLVSDYTPFMKNQIQVFNGAIWVTVFETGGNETNDNFWQFFSYDVTAHKNNKFQARWCHTITVNGAYDSPSWSVDDVTLGPAACMQ